MDGISCVIRLAFDWQNMLTGVLGRTKISVKSIGNGFADHSAMAFSKRFVYVLKNGWQPARYYTGVTSHVAARLKAHNGGLCAATAGARPWQVDVVVTFPDEQRALAFERYLKSGSGTAFAQRHLR